MAIIGIEIVETPFDLAFDLSRMALRVDESKAMFPEHLHQQIRENVEGMHTFAEMLAGDRKEELYK